MCVVKPLSVDSVSPPIAFLSPFNTYATDSTLYPSTEHCLYLEYWKSILSLALAVKYSHYLLAVA